jgi:hypothetical protein
MSQRIEFCVKCDEPTGKAGRCEDSLYVSRFADGDDEYGPLCEECYTKIMNGELKP